MVHTDYMKYIADVSGSRSKNRFKFEIYWGLDRFLDEMKIRKDFCMVFDYVCDIEIHFKDSFEFYQIKTTSARSYPLGKLVKIDSGKKNSIIGTLYKIRDMDISEKGKKAKLVLVSNANFSSNRNIKIGKPNTELSISDIDSANDNKITKTLETEFDTSQIDLSGIFFATTDLTLSSYKETMIGRLCKYYDCEYGDTLLKPSALLNVIAEEIQQKADCEEKFDTYEELLKKKSVSAKRLSSVMELYAEKAVSLIDVCKKNIDQTVINFIDKRRLYSKISKVVINSNKNLFLNKLKQQIKSDINLKTQDESNKTLFDGTLFEISRKYINDENCVQFPPELDKEERAVLTLIVLIELEKEF